ncbi:MAG TPA: hypothetical protein VNJ10_13245 [Sphingomonas sp.]|nr:hypothetical protein [Sphingomonas sp.]
MADTDTPETDAKKPVTRRRAPRKTSVAKPGAATSTAKPVAASKPEPVATPAADTPAVPAARKVKPAPKPRSTKRSTPRPTPARKTPVPTPVATAPEKVGGKWGAAAIFSGVAVVGAAVGALLTLRGSTPKTPAPRPAAPPVEPPVESKPKGTHAHQADGQDASKSFAAGIADPGTVPET